VVGKKNALKTYVYVFKKLKNLSLEEYFPTVMISDAKKKFFDIVTNLFFKFFFFFSCNKNFLLQLEKIKKSFSQEKKTFCGKKINKKQMFCNLIKIKYLGITKHFCECSLINIGFAEWYASMSITRHNIKIPTKNFAKTWKKKCDLLFKKQGEEIERKKECIRCSWQPRKMLAMEHF